MSSSAAVGVPLAMLYFLVNINLKQTAYRFKIVYLGQGTEKSQVNDFHLNQVVRMFHFLSTKSSFTRLPHPTECAQWSWARPVRRLFPRARLRLDA